MFYLSVNYVAVLIAALASMLVGFIWYSPLLFAKPWMKYAKLDEKKLKKAQKTMGKTYGISFLATLVTAFALALMINATLVVDLYEGLAVSGVVWLGFVTTTMLTGVLFGEMPWGLFLINSGYQLASFLVMGAILTTWI
jgi:hypothetical protein